MTMMYEGTGVMTQVKTFAAPTEDKVEKLINEWLAEHKLISIDDIKWSSCAAMGSHNLMLNTRYSAMIIYQCGTEKITV